MNQIAFLQPKGGERLGLCVFDSFFLPLYNVMIVFTIIFLDEEKRGHHSCIQYDFKKRKNQAAQREQKE